MKHSIYETFRLKVKSLSILFKLIEYSKNFSLLTMIIISSHSLRLSKKNLEILSIQNYEYIIGYVD